MALTHFGANDPKTIKLYSKELFREALKETIIFKFMGTSPRSIIQRFLDLETQQGGSIEYDLLMQTSGEGVTGAQWLEDNEDEMIFHHDSVVVEQLRKAHIFTRMSQQRSAYDLREAAKMNLADWHAGKWDEMAFRYWGGDTTINHGQQGMKPDADHYILSGDVTKTGDIDTDEASLDANDVIDLMDLDYLKEYAKTLTPMIRPAKVDGDELYIMALHEYSLVDLRTSANANATIKWHEIQANANVRSGDNPIFSGANGMYNGVVIHSNTRVFAPRANVRRNVFAGAQSLVFAVGAAYDKIDQQEKGLEGVPMSWVENPRDYADKKGVAAGVVLGIKAPTFNNKFYGHLVLSSYAAPHV